MVSPAKEEDDTISGNKMAVAINEKRKTRETNSEEADGSDELAPASH